MEGRLNFLLNVSPSFILLYVFFPSNRIGKLFLGYTCKHVGCWSLVSWIMPLNSITVFRSIWSSTSNKERVANNTTMKRTRYALYQENHEPFSQFLLIISVFTFYCTK